MLKGKNVDRKKRRQGHKRQKRKNVEFIQKRIGTFLNLIKSKVVFQDNFYFN